MATVSMFAFGALAGPTLSLSEKADQLERAAINREMAADSQLSQAKVHVSASDSYRAVSTGEGNPRQSELKRAAVMLEKAGNLEMAAARNLDRAGRNWRAAAKIQSKLDNDSEEKMGTEQADYAEGRALEAIKRAAANYEVAADLLLEQGPSTASMAAKLSERAASCRESLATR